MSQQKKALTSFQIRAARALLKWSAEDLALRSSVSLRTIRRAELAGVHTSMTVANDLAVRHSLEAAGVEFIEENGGGPGVRLRKQQWARFFGRPISVGKPRAAYLEGRILAKRTENVADISKSPSFAG